MSTASPGLSSLLPAGSALLVGDRHRVATGDGTRLHAIVAGAGTPLVLTHGALLSLEAWALLWQPLLAAGHQVIAYDLRGHGRSTLGRSGFGVQAYAQDLAAGPGPLRRPPGGGGGPLHRWHRRPRPGGRRPGRHRCPSGRSGAHLHRAQGIGDSLQNRLLAPVVFSGLIHEVVRRRRLGTLFTRTLFGSHPDPDSVEFAPPHGRARRDRRPSTRPRRCCGSTSGIGCALPAVLGPSGRHPLPIKRGLASTPPPNSRHIRTDRLLLLRPRMPRA